MHSLSDMGDEGPYLPSLNPYKVTVELSCANCVKSKVIPNDWYRCSITQQEWLIIGANHLCKYWKPSVDDVSVWLLRAKQVLKEE